MLSKVPQWGFYSTTSAAKLPAENITMKIAQVDAEPGEYWLVTKDGEDPWPVVICDEDIVRSYFKEKKRPEGARRRDGTWGEEFRIRGKRFGKRYFPALKLGIMKL